MTQAPELPPEDEPVEGDRETIEHELADGDDQRDDEEADDDEE
jgi:hypothetical protein